MVVGTTGWYGTCRKVREEVEKRGIGFLYGANFSIGINLLFEAARSGGAALQHQYSRTNLRAPSRAEERRAFGDRRDAAADHPRNIGQELEITSFREGDVVGMHEVDPRLPQRHYLSVPRLQVAPRIRRGSGRGAEWLSREERAFSILRTSGETL